jgi:hypothetical protein
MTTKTRLTVLLQRNAVQGQQKPDLQGPPSKKRSSEIICTALSGNVKAPSVITLITSIIKTFRRSTVAGSFTRAGLHHGINLKTSAVETEFLNTL